MHKNGSFLVDNNPLTLARTKIYGCRMMVVKRPLALFGAVNASFLPQLCNNTFQCHAIIWQKKHIFHCSAAIRAEAAPRVHKQGGWIISEVEHSSFINLPFHEVFGSGNFEFPAKMIYMATKKKDSCVDSAWDRYLSNSFW